jgi:4'-phosphopantetheinyl transferase EntD
MIQSLLPSCVVSYEEFTDIPGEAPFPGEETVIAQAVAGRRSEFITARRCARRALADLGHPAAPIPSGPRREPLWPAGFTGSITHCAGYRAAAVARLDDLAAIGVDAEPDKPLPPDVETTVASPDERARLRTLDAAMPAVNWPRLLFSAKESVYKAWFPLTGRWLGFSDADLHVDAEAGTFRARLLVDGSRIDGGAPLTELHGRFLVRQGLILTAVTVGHRLGRGAAKPSRSTG